MAQLAMQRIEGLSFSVALAQALRIRSRSRTLIKEFHYPRLGPGQMWEKFQKAIEDGGGRILLDTKVTHIDREGLRIGHIKASRGGRVIEVSGDHYISSIPLKALIDQMNPEPEEIVRRAAENLRYRDFILVGLIVEKKDLFPDQWIYVHNPDVSVGRIQNFKNWSPAMVPDQERTSLGAEYFCSEGDNLWNMADDELIELASRELASLELVEKEFVLEGIVYRQRKAYPVYDFHYEDSLKVLQSFISNIENLHSIGRNGLHRYDNQDHAMLTGIKAARELLDIKE
jgi:protoporphyrinogen oxidase